MVCMHYAPEHDFMYFYNRNVSGRLGIHQVFALIDKGSRRRRHQSGRGRWTMCQYGAEPSTNNHPSAHMAAIVNAPPVAARRGALRIRHLLIEYVS